MPDPREEAAVPWQESKEQLQLSQQAAALLTHRVSTLHTVPGDVAFKNGEKTLPQQ